MRSPLSAGNVLVVGSLNVDHLSSVDRLPGAGETVMASRIETRFGGKGANQAVAAARQGSSVRMIGSVGNDAAGRDYRRHLRQTGIDDSGVRTARGCPTGAAFITVDANGENSIVVVPGANDELCRQQVKSRGDEFRRASVVLTQFEVPMDAVLATLRCARTHGVHTLLNPSPWREGFPWGDVPVDLVIVNEVEAAALFDQEARALKEPYVTKIRRRLKSIHAGGVVVTRGARATWFIDAARLLVIPTLAVEPVDTVGAGDAFAGTLAARLAGGATLEEALRCANCAGALATLAQGAQEAIPSRRATNRAVASMQTREPLTRSRIDATG